MDVGREQAGAPDHLTERGQRLVDALDQSDGVKLLQLDKGQHRRTDGFSGRRKFLLDQRGTLRGEREREREREIYIQLH